MKDVLEKLHASARLETEPMFADPVAHWPMHQRLLREASRVVRDNLALAGAEVEDG